MARLVAQNLTPGAPAKPPGLSKAAAAAWDQIVAELAESGIQISKVHRSLIETAATLVADIADARETVETEGAYLTNDKTGVVQAHPAARRLDALRRDLVKALSLLGMRQPVKGGGEKGETLEELLG